MRAPPYPPTTRSRGWRFELDLERIRQSDTWAVAGPDARPWLLMTWATAWEQTPCGSLPNDDRLICAHIGMVEKQFDKLKPVLLRGWELCEDGRLYHATITEHVLEMLARRRKEADRKALARAGKGQDGARTPAGVPKLSHGTPGGVRPESDTGTGTGSFPPEKKERPVRKRTAAFDACGMELPDWLDRAVWVDWIEDRKERKKQVTSRGAEEQIKKLQELRADGHNPEEVIRHAIRSGNQGLFPPPSAKGHPSPRQHTRHTGFEANNYREGITEDGHLA